MRLTADLKARLYEAIDGEAWDVPGETTESDATRAHIDAVPTGTVLAPAADEFDADEQPVTDLAHAWVTVDYFGFQNVAGDWHDDDVRPRYPDVTVPMVGEDANVFAIIGRVARALRRAGHADAAREFTDEASSQHSYDAVLQVVMSWVEVE